MDSIDESTGCQSAAHELLQHCAHFWRRYSASCRSSVYVRCCCCRAWVLAAQSPVLTAMARVGNRRMRPIGRWPAGSTLCVE